MTRYSSASVQGPLLAGLAAIAIAGGSDAAAQSGGYIDMLAEGTSSALPMRSFDPATRARNRYAVVIGNADYEDITDLPNAVADAQAMAEFLRAQGYIVSYHENVAKRDFEDVLRRVLFDTGDDTEVVVFYAGHGFQIGSENYLVPVDANFDTVYDLPFEAVSLGSLVGIVGARARLSIIILDSCRNNPFAGRSAMTLVNSDLRETRTGFASQAAPLNSLLVYSTAPGSVAFDGAGTNSPFTASFIEEVSANPDELAKDVFEAVRRSVYTLTSGRQVPWDSSTLVEPASFGLGAALLRPIAVDGAGTGITRGVARVTTETAPVEEIVPAALRRISIAGSFSDEVAIGPALIASLAGIAADGPVRVVAGPRYGNLTLAGPDGVARDIVGQDIAAEDLTDLVLLNRSVQMRAADLGDVPIISDQFTLDLGTDMLTVDLSLTPDPCDIEAGDHLDPDGMGLTRYPNEIRPEMALAACQASIAAAPDVGRYHYQLGRALLALRDYEGAHAAFEQARDLGHVRAWYALGAWSYDQLRLASSGEASSDAAPDEVLQLYARGATEGDPYAMYALGWQLLRYGETDDVQVEGYDMVMRSLEVGHTFAMNAMAQLYLDEDGEYYEPARGLRFLRESVAREDIYGYNALGLVYWRGRGGEEIDFARALDLFTKASDGGHPTAPYNIARMYRDGEIGGGVDMARAVEYFQLSLDRGYAQAAAQAAYIIRSEEIPGLDGYDAAMIAARGSVLVNSNGADDALEQLTAMSETEMTGGLQRLLISMGASVEATGDYDAATAAALSDILADQSLPAAETALDRIQQAASAAWRRSPFRADLY